MCKFRKFLGMLEDEIDLWQYSEEFRDLFHELCKEHSCGEYSPEKVREKIKNERDEIVRSKNLLCPNCEKSSKRFTPEGLFNHFITTHKDQTEHKFNSNPNQIKRQDYGIMLGMLGKISLDRINSTADMIEKNRMWEYLLGNIFGKEHFRFRSAHQLYVDLCEKKFGSIQNYTKELMEKFSFDEVSQLYYLAEVNEDEYKEEVKRNDYIEKILTHFADGINSVKHFSENATQTYGKIFIKHFPKYGSIENPTENVLSEFSTEDLRVITFNFNGKI